MTESINILSFNASNMLISFINKDKAIKKHLKHAMKKNKHKNI